MIVHTAYRNNIQKLVAIMGELSLLIIKGSEYKGILKSGGSHCSLRNILCVGSKFIDKASARRG